MRGRRWLTNLCAIVALLGAVATLPGCWGSDDETKDEQETKSTEQSDETKS